MTRISPPELPPWLEAMLPTSGPAFERFRVDVGGYRMHVMTVGEGRPVLMLHGNPTWGFLYRRVVEALAGDSIRVILPDLIGLGFSDRPKSAEEHTLANHGRWLGSLLDQLEPPDRMEGSASDSLDRLVFVGQDWGGPIGLRALAERSERLAGLVIMNTVVGPPREDFRPTKFHRFARRPLRSFIAFRLLGFPQRALGRAQGDRSSISGQVARAYRYPLRGLRRNAAPLALARMVPDRQDHPSIPELERCAQVTASFTGPQEIVWGDRDPVLGRALSRTRELMPHCTKVTHTEAGHFLQEEVPDEIAAAVRRVVAEASF